MSSASAVAIDGYAPMAWAAAFEQVARASGATLLIGPGTDRSAEVMAHVAARMGIGLAANVVAIEGGEPFRVTRQRWAGSLLEDATIEGPVRALTVAAHVVEPVLDAEAGPATVEPFPPELSPADMVVRPTVVFTADGKVVRAGRVRLRNGVSHDSLLQEQLVPGVSTSLHRSVRLTNKVGATAMVDFAWAR